MRNSSQLGAAVLVLLLSVVLPASAQDSPPYFAVTGGVGNVLGGLGVGLERYLARSRVSASAGLGYWPDASNCSGTVSAAGAVRGFTGGLRHRAFIEVSYSLLAVSCLLFSEPDAIDRHYGLGVSLGYRYTGGEGFTLTAGAGVGDPSGSDFGTELMILLGLGYTWKR